MRLNLENVKAKPFVIGIAGGTASGKTLFMHKIVNATTEFPICEISLDCYHKSQCDIEQLSFDEYNNEAPEAFDFDLLISHLNKLRNGKSINLPQYDFLTNSLTETTIELSPAPVIIIEGALAFHNEKIRNMMDLKIFIDTDSDIRLSQRVLRDIMEREQNVKEVIMKYNRFVKPVYEQFILPSKTFADVVILSGNDTVIRIVSEYLKIQMNKVKDGKYQNLFSSINEIIDPKHMFFEHRILVTNERRHVEFFKQLFEDFINKEIEQFFVEEMREKIINILPVTLINYFREQTSFSTNLPKINLIVTDFDDLSTIIWEKYRNVFFFKTIILTDDDMKIPQMIFSKNPKCKLVVNSIFLAPKFAEISLNSNESNLLLNNLLFNCLFFSDFFIRFEHVIRKDEGVFEPKKSAELFKNIITKEFLI